MAELQLTQQSLGVGYARELIAEHKAGLLARGLLIDGTSLEGRLAMQMEQLIRCLPEGDNDHA